MREILFKAKRIDNGKWVEGYLYIRKDGVAEINYYNKEWDCERYTHEVDANTICQYTGMTDKNGNKIWEKDILSDDDMVSVVRWDEEEARFVIDDYGTKGCLMEYGFDECMGEYGVVDTYGFDDFCSMKSFEVIGNVFDNAELLGGK